MRKTLTVLILSISVFSINADEFVITDKKKHYVAILNKIIADISSNDIMLNWSKNKLAKARNALNQETISVEDHKKICSIILSVLPGFSGDIEKQLNKILTPSLMHLLNAGIYDFIGSSFYPEECDLETIMLDGEKLTPEEFLQIQQALEEDIESNKTKESIGEYTQRIKSSRHDGT
ncbi:MAG: hypothetical protein LBG04_03125 [Holosporaceae bacterium]|jgi:hypothetical protein|nr:hypothetical protein [Holosporaceae bacterium]